MQVVGERKRKRVSPIARKTPGVQSSVIIMVVLIPGTLSCSSKL